MLGILSGVLFAYAGDLPQVSALDNYSPSTITRVYAVERPGDRRVRDPAARRRRLRRHQPAAAPGDHRHRGRGVRPALRREHLAHRRRGGHRHRRAAARAGREHAHPAARAQPQGSVRPDQRESRSSGRSARRSSRSRSRSATRRRKSSRSTATRCTSATARTASRPRRGCTFSKSNKQLNARGSGAHRRHLPDARAPEPVRRHEARDAAPQHRAAAHGRRALHHAGAGRRRQAEADRHARAAEPAAGHRAVLRRGGPQAPRARVRREGPVRERTLGDDDARREAAGDRRTARSSTGCARYDKRHGWRQAEAQRDRRRPHDRRLQGRALDAGRSPPATSCRPSSSPRRRRARRACAIGRYHADLAARRLRLDAPDVGGRSVQAGRSHRGRRSRRSTTAADGGAGHARADAARRRRARWRSTTTPARSRRWSAAGTSAAASSTARCRRTGSSDRRSSRSSTRRRSIAASRRRRSSSTRR